MALIALRQQIVLVTRSAMLGDLAVGFYVNFPEHRESPWPGLAAYRGLLCRRSPGRIETEPAGRPSVARRPERPLDSGRKSRSKWMSPRRPRELCRGNRLPLGRATRAAEY